MVGVVHHISALLEPPSKSIPEEYRPFPHTILGRKFQISQRQRQLLSAIHLVVVNIVRAICTCCQHRQHYMYSLSALSALYGHAQPPWVSYEQPVHHMSALLEPPSKSIPEEYSPPPLPRFLLKSCAQGYLAHKKPPPP